MKNIELNLWKWKQQNKIPLYLFNNIKIQIKIIDYNKQLFYNNAEIKYYEMEMMLLKQIDKTNKLFEDIKHIDENGVEFWYARELMLILQYSNWQNFEKIINKAKISCENSDISVFEHFIDVNKLSKRANT